MIRDLLHDAPDPVDRADVCVIGAGAAGICLAVELAQAGRQVLLLEGGGEFVEEAAQEPYWSDLCARPHRGIHDGRFRAHGGTTTRWGGQILPLDCIDFESREWVPGSGWPLSRQELLPFYRRALELEGLGATLSNDAAVWSRIGEREPAFSDITSYLSRWCPEPNFARLHSAVLSGSERIRMWLHANAVELLLNAETGTGVRVRTQAGAEHVFHANEFVFCMGAIESSRFFLQPRAALQACNRSGLLGRHFQDHIDCNVATIEPYSRAELARSFDGIFVDGLKYQPKLKLRAQTQRQHRTLNIGASFAYEHPQSDALERLRTTAKRALRGDLKEISATDLRSIAWHAPLLFGQTFRYAVRHRSYQPRTAKIALRVHCEQEPLSSNAIELGEERDSLGLLRTRLHWDISALELHSIRSFVAIATRALTSVARVTPLANMHKDAVLLAACEDSFHHMGGMRMHPSPAHGVVDTDLRLHGTRNVWVCSSAVFPTSGFSNPTHTIIALAARLAAQLSRASHSSMAYSRQPAQEGREPSKQEEGVVHR